MAISDAHATFSERLAVSERPEHAIQQVVGEARAASEAEAASSASALAERAFVAVITRAAAGEASLATAAPADAAARSAAARGAPADFVSGYVGELLGQYARHVTAREAGRLTEGERGLSVSQTRRLTRNLAAAAEEIGRAGPVRADTADAIRANWEVLVRDVFSRGRRLPEPRR